MKQREQREKRFPVVAGALLCLAALALSVLLQSSGYLGYLDSDMAAEVILGKRQADTHSLVQMDWLYSTEIRILQVNLLYALAFLFTPSFFLARVIGNTLGLALSMGACAFLCRKLHLPWGRSLAASAMLALAAGDQYAAYVVIGGYYIVHIALAFLAAGLWMSASAQGKNAAVGFVLLCMILGFLSVRYVLCIICPMAVIAALDTVLTPYQDGLNGHDGARVGRATAAGCLACLLGYAASEAAMPRLFASGVGSATSFVFNALDGAALMEGLFVIFTDFLKLLGWRGEAALFSGAGVVNLCIVGILLLSILAAVRVYRALDERACEQRAQKQMLRLAVAALGVNTLCFLFIKGAYLSRYLILAVIYLVPAMVIVMHRERNKRLRVALTVLLCVQMGTSCSLLINEASEKQARAAEEGRDMMAAANFLLDAGYTHGYGTFWNVRVMQERTQGALTFTGVVPVQTEEGAAADVSLDMIRGLEPDAASDLDACPGTTFLLLTKPEAEALAPWLLMTSAPNIYDNGTYAVYGFSSSQELVGDMMWGRMKLEHVFKEDDTYVMSPQGRMRVPTAWREAGDYALRLNCEGIPASDSVVQMYTGRDFSLLKEQRLAQGENEVRFTLREDDKYFMILIKSGEAQMLRVNGLRLDKR